jgi:hypothetical protein
VRHDDFHMGETDRDRIQMARQRALDRRLADEGCARVKQHGQTVFACVTPKRVKPLFIRSEAGIHRQQFDAVQSQLAMADPQFILPAVLRGIDGKKADERVGMPVHVFGDVSIIHPQTTESGLPAEDNRDGLGRCRGAVLLVSHRQIHLNASPRATGLAAKIVAEVPGVCPRVRMDINDDRGTLP